MTAPRMAGAEETNPGGLRQATALAFFPAAPAARF